MNCPIWSHCSAHAKESPPKYPALSTLWQFLEDLVCIWKKIEPALAIYGVLGIRTLDCRMVGRLRQIHWAGPAPMMVLPIYNYFKWTIWSEQSFIGYCCKQPNIEILIKQSGHTVSGTCCESTLNRQTRLVHFARKFSRTSRRCRITSDTEVASRTSNLKLDRLEGI